jgi:hypothetical protein
VHSQPKHAATIKEIAETLMPWRCRWHKEGVSFEISAQVDEMQTQLSDGLTSREAIIKNRDDARDIIKLIAKLQPRLKKACFLWWSRSPAIAASNG